MKKASGFTLIELLVVISIIATLAAVLTPNVAQARQRANDAAVQAYTRQVVTAMETFLTDRPFNNAYDVMDRNVAAGGTAGACAVAPSAVDQPLVPAQYDVADPYYDLSNYGAPYPFPQSVKRVGSDLVPDVNATPDVNTGCFIVYDGKGGYGVAAQSITNNIQTLYNGRLCTWRWQASTNTIPEWAALTNNKDPNEWSASVNCTAN